MNNKYDREVGCVDVTMPESPAAVKLLLLLTGEEVLAEVIEHLGSDEVTLIRPMRVMVQSTSSDGDSRSSTIAFTDWMPLSESREIRVSRKMIGVITTPLDSLIESYTNG